MQKTVLLLALVLVLAGALVLSSVPRQNVTDALNVNAATSPALALSEEADKKTPAAITVESSQTVTASATKAEIWFSIETLAPTAQASQQQNATQSQAVMTALTNMSISGNNVQTVSYSIYQKTEWEPDLRRSVNKGFETVNSFKVTVTDLSKTGKVIDAVIAAGATRVSSISFTVDDSKQAELKKMALTKAAQEAKSKANAIASGLNVQLGKVLSATETGSVFIPYYRDFVVQQAAGAPSPETPVLPGDVSVTAHLTVSFEIQ